MVRNTSCAVSTYFEILIARVSDIEAHMSPHPCRECRCIRLYPVDSRAVLNQKRLSQVGKEGNTEEIRAVTGRKVPNERVGHMGFPGNQPRRVQIWIEDILCSEERGQDGDMA
ncbi:hypothetical protein CIHG_06941 [Coccidioides immitis H538.4]|uniref:Uncharacterized protein n=2 Tax=Coccidioides immitis TaxID=5501 RepID=A0A0J8RVT4_COCIT|nr:hypothetical protein CIRG_09986 [Coccidioides immitis RMSCC 2394]KMU89270.1 hypothetical protein CIHG_06941 [Coccidioides immitis H538.4]